MKKYNYVLILLICFFYTLSSYSQNISLSKNGFEIIENRVTVLYDSLGKYNDKEVINGKYFSLFKPFQGAILDGEAANAWFKFNFINHSENTDEFYVGTDKFQYIDAYFKQNGQIIGPFKSGMAVKKSERSLQNEAYSFFRFNCKKGDSVIVFLKVKNEFIDESYMRYRLPLVLMDINEYERAYERADAFTYLYLGASILLIALVLILATFTRQKNFFYFLGYLSFNLIFLVGVDPHFGYKIFGNTQVQGRPNLIWGEFAAIFQILFSQNLLEIKKYYPTINKILNVVIILYLITSVFVLIGGFLTLRLTFSNLAFVIQYPTLFVYCILMARKKHLPSKIMLGSFYLNVAAAYIFGMQCSEILPPFIYGMSAVRILQIGNLIGGSIFAFIVGLKINEERILRLQQEKEKQIILSQQNEMLEKQVNERTIELQNSLTNLKATQTKLIQSEKLASLGELTAGIAHEIQNPLNFVNNFSEVSVELLHDMNVEIEKGDIEEVKLISENVILNLEKISYHGNRASSIVRGMLEHSRTSTGERTLTDINALAEEYLRLSYHGMRAKDKLFNSDFKTDFDTNLPAINIISQDIGRVLLNLFNNAFYAVKGNKGGGKVTVSTENINNQIVIKVKDNGIGMSDVTQSKIFQPFFTTKPAGEGTGLGLSLAYDIITKGHNGNIEVESKEGEGTIFTIKIPIQHSKVK